MPAVLGLRSAGELQRRVSVVHLVLFFQEQLRLVRPGGVRGAVMDPISIAAELVRFTLAALFAVAAVAKASNWSGFVRALAEMTSAPRVVRTPMAVGLVSVEIALALCLAFNVLPRFGLTLSGLLLLAFASLISYRLIIGNTLPASCGCLGSTSPLSWSMVCRNGSLAAASFASVAPVSSDVKAVALAASAAVLLGTCLTFHGRNTSTARS